MESRKFFIEQVREKIIKEHGSDGDSSYIFGLSGKWGVGKTRFLQDLQKELEKNNFKVSWVKPWKFGDDKISFLRNFLTAISSISKKSWWEKIRDWINNRNDTRDLYYDTDSKNIHWGFLLILFLTIANTILLYLFWFPLLHELYPKFFAKITSEVKVPINLLAAILFVPFLIPIISNLLTEQRGSKSITTIDKFDELLTKYLARLKHGKFDKILKWCLTRLNDNRKNKLVNNIVKHFEDKKVIVFIDDLDRVTPEIARNCLDQMRVFFDKPEITFFVAGDHTVLERYIGSQTLPNGSPEEKLEEGRRYLKKVFNLYWQLPAPIDSVFDAFLRELFETNKKSIEEIFAEQADRDTFAKYLKKYFEKNYRQVIRFFDTALFTFKIIKNQLENADSENKKYFQQMQSNPLLVVRILMIQELCMMLFEAIQNDTGILRTLEDAVERQNSGVIDQTLSNYKLTVSQTLFIRKFLYEEPRFFKNKILMVYSFEPFLYLAADPSFGDARGLSKEDFLEILRTADPNAVANSIQNCGEEKAKGIATAVSELMTQTADPAVKSGYLRTMCLALTSIPDHFSQKFFLDALKSQDFASIFNGNTVPNPSRLQVTQDVWRWLDTQDHEITKGFEGMFPFIQISDLDQLVRSPKLGYFSTKIATRWIAEQYPSNPAPIFAKMKLIFPDADTKAIGEKFNPILDSFVNNLIGMPEGVEKNEMFDILMDYVPGAKEKLRETVFERIKGKDEAVWLWSNAKVVDKHEPWSQEELEKIISDLILESQNQEEFMSALRFAKGKVVQKVDVVWKEMYSKSKTLLEDSAQALSNEPDLPTPPVDVARMLFAALVRKIDTVEDAEKIILLGNLQNKATWEKVEKMPEQTKVSALLQSQNSDVVSAAKTTLQTWGITTD